MLSIYTDERSSSFRHVLCCYRCTSLLCFHLSRGLGWLCNHTLQPLFCRPNTSEKETPWTETDKIRVCVRKRPLGLREERRGEVNILMVEDQETLLLHEKKEAVDLTQYILQVVSIS